MTPWPETTARLGQAIADHVYDRVISVRCAKSAMTIIWQNVSIVVVHALHLYTLDTSEFMEGNFQRPFFQYAMAMAYQPTLCLRKKPSSDFFFTFVHCVLKYVLCGHF